MDTNGCNIIVLLIFLNYKIIITYSQDIHFHIDLDPNDFESVEQGNDYKANSRNFGQKNRRRGLQEIHKELKEVDDGNQYVYAVLSYFDFHF